ncbi:TolC family protein [Putridiphycobacter roseus]|uniref:TolC family protein n=1 Tax=Putridiphycobacter roseus TaxID=2219161 RepID=A0A2W1N3F7_9FLAO|nr:TolC family protein [Putridiphycobacter roseus]PZE18100.1 TolC family protein [Putridiphycobacter roseus]
MKNLLIIGVLLFNTVGLTQEKLTLEQAIAIAMDKNYDIQIYENNLSQAANNQDIKNTGYLPTVSVSAGGNYSNNNAYVVRQTGEELNIDGIQSTAYNASIGVNYVLFNGMYRKHNFEKLKTAYELAGVQKQIQIDNTILNVYAAYYNIAKNTINLNSYEESFDISKNRLKRTEYQLKYGQKTSLDVLNAKVDVNNDSINLINGQIALDNEKRTLNYLLGFPVNQSFQVDESVEVNRLLDIDLITSNMKENNNIAKQYELNKNLAKYDVKLNQSGWMPQVSTAVSYGLNNGNYGPTSLFATQNATGLSAGLSLSWDVFDGGATSTKVQNAKIAVETQGLYQSQIELNLSNELANTWASYLNQLVIINTEEMNVEVANQNFLKTQEQYNLGQISSIDFRQAQLNLINAKVSLTTAMFNAKIAEIQLKKLEGTLINP